MPRGERPQGPRLQVTWLGVQSGEEGRGQEPTLSPTSPLTWPVLLTSLGPPL